MSAQVCARGRDWLESVALLLSVSEHDRIDVMALGGAKISMWENVGETSRRLESRLVNGVARPIKERERRRETE